MVDFKNVEFEVTGIKDMGRVLSNTLLVNNGRKFKLKPTLYIPVFTIEDRPKGLKIRNYVNKVRKIKDVDVTLFPKGYSSYVVLDCDVFKVAIPIAENWLLLHGILATKCVGFIDNIEDLEIQSRGKARTAVFSINNKQKDTIYAGLLLFKDIQKKGSE